MEDIKNILEIFLVTYNRKEYLKSTLESILFDNSPIKNCDIYILDNKSNDGSSELIDKYAIARRNLHHIRHNRNIGGNANICRCYELATKKYFWILCDDDEYDFSSWNEVVVALENDVDAIVVANYLNPEKNIAQLLCQLSFVPAAIYKTSNITDTVMQNAEFQISVLFPHLALACELINVNANIRFLKGHAIVNRLSHPGNESYTRGISGNKHPIMSDMTWAVGMMETLQIINDSRIKKFVIENLEMERKEKILIPRVFIQYNMKFGHCSRYNRHVYFSFLPSFYLRFCFTTIAAVIYLRSILSHYWFVFRQNLKKTRFGQFLLPFKRAVYRGHINRSNVEF